MDRTEFYRFLDDTRIVEWGPFALLGLVMLIKIIIYLRNKDAYDTEDGESSEEAPKTKWSSDNNYNKIYPSVKSQVGMKKKSDSYRNR